MDDSQLNDLLIRLSTASLAPVSVEREGELGTFDDLGLPDPLPETISDSQVVHGPITSTRPPWSVFAGLCFMLAGFAMALSDSNPGAPDITFQTEHYRDAPVFPVATDRAERTKLWQILLPDTPIPTAK